MNSLIFYFAILYCFQNGDVISLIGLRITQPFCLLLSFLDNRIPCKHNACAANNFAPLDMPFLFIIV